MNAIGLQNPGIDLFCERDIPFLKQYDTKIIVNVCGHAPEEYLAVVERLADQPIDMMEINISCPNVKAGGIAFGTNPRAAAAVVRQVKDHTSKVVITKLSPNVTSITELALAVEAAGTDVISLINTLIGMKIDVERQRPVLGNITGGLSGPAVRPVAVRMCYEVAQKVKVPLIGMGGIMNAADALEFFLAGANAVAVGTGNFVDPTLAVDICGGLLEYMDRHQVKQIKDLVGLALPGGKRC